MSAASARAVAWAEKRKAMQARAEALRQERNGKRVQEEAFKKALEEAGEQLVTSWTNDDFASPTPTKQRQFSPRSGTPSSSTCTSDKELSSSQKKKKTGGDKAMLARLAQIEAGRVARRLGAATTKQRAQEVLAAHPGMDPNDVEFLQMVRAWRKMDGRERLADCHGVDGGDSDDDDGGGGPRRAGNGNGVAILCCIRKRPLLSAELEQKVFDVVSCNFDEDGNEARARNTVVLHLPRTAVDLSKTIQNNAFQLNGGVYDGVSTAFLYRKRILPLVRHVLKGGPEARSTIFAYGQTGSGKTHTMLGANGGGGGGGGGERGIYALALAELFHGLPRSGSSGVSGVTVSFFELYRGDLFDLLAQHAKLELREDGAGNLDVVGLQRRPVNNAQEVMELVGSVRRTTSSTTSNDTSSRSHAILQVELPPEPGTEEEPCRLPSSSSSSSGLWSRQAQATAKPKPKRGKITFVDLAGSEWFNDSEKHSKEAEIEGAEINKSLLALKECIRALGGRDDYGAKASRHTPFRGSKLTRLLKDSLVSSSSPPPQKGSTRHHSARRGGGGGGGAGAGRRTPTLLCRTLMIAHVSPASMHAEHSLNTLRYAERVGSLTAGQTEEGGRLGSSGGTHCGGDRLVAPSSTSSPSSSSSSSSSTFMSSAPRTTLANGSAKTSTVKAASSASTTASPLWHTNRQTDPRKEQQAASAPAGSSPRYPRKSPPPCRKQPGARQSPTSREKTPPAPAPPLPPPPHHHHHHHQQKDGLLFEQASRPPLETVRARFDFQRPVGLGTDAHLWVLRADEGGQARAAGVCGPASPATPPSWRVTAVAGRAVASDVELRGAVQRVRSQQRGHDQSSKVWAMMQRRPSSSQDGSGLTEVVFERLR